MSKDVHKKRYRSTFYLNGKRYEATGKNQREADQKAAIKRDKLERGEVGISGDMSVARWAEEWLETYKRPFVGEAQYRNYCTFINGVIAPAIGAKKLKDIRDIELQKIINSRIGYSKSNLNKLRHALGAIFKQAHISRLISHNPAEYLTIPKAEDKSRRAITPDERKQILGLAKTHYAGLWIKTLLFTGMRPNETRALDWKHINFDKRIIRVEQAMKAGTKEIGPPKSSSGVRDIPISNAIYDDLLSAKGQPFEPVFTQPTTGKRHTKNSMDCLWRNFKRELDISIGAVVYRNQIVESKLAPDIATYCLRHSFCTDLQDAGVPINMARYLMGHSDISITAKIYTHTTDKAIQDAANKINAFADN